MTSSWRPTINVTNWSSRKLHGKGAKWSIMAQPRAWQIGDGGIYQLTPNANSLVDVMQGAMTMDRYRDDFMRRARRLGDLKPGELVGTRNGVGIVATVESGDSILCGCSKAKAKRNECHRVWAAYVLFEAGWRVILDGAEVAI